MGQRLPKFKRAPDALPRRQLTATSVRVIKLLASYQFLPTSLLIALSRASKNITHRHLQLLFHRGLVNRFSFPRVGNPGEFHYYLDNPATLSFLPDGGTSELTSVIKRNREKRYADVHDLSRVEEMQGRLLFLKHEVMISRFHASLELSCQAADGVVELERFRQGPPIWQSVQVPAMAKDPDQRVLIESGSVEKRALRPDAFFTLRFPREPEGRQRAHFFYEADRETESTTRVMEKLRVYSHYLVRLRQHEADFGIKRVRAVLIQTTTDRWCRQLREAERLRTGSHDSPLFWFSCVEGPATSRPSTFEPIWATAAGASFHRLTD